MHLRGRNQTPLLKSVPTETEHDQTNTTKTCPRFTRSDETRLWNNTGGAADSPPYVEDSCFTADSGLSPECT
ncbi:unnamed protein product [Ectocarpus sp. CCAP 1310/34]|nr:unnamed protein product [Ectocarpus sp. CCAP 1310/34]